MWFLRIPVAAHPSLLLSSIPHLDYPTIHTSIIQLVGIRVVCIWGLSEQHGSEHSGTRVPCILENAARHPEVALCVFTSGHTAKFSPRTALGVFRACQEDPNGKIQVCPIKERGTIWGPSKCFSAVDWVRAVRQQPLENGPAPQRAAGVHHATGPTCTPSISELPMNTPELPPGPTTLPNLRSPKTIS